MKARIRRAVAVLLLLLVAVGFLALAVLYLIHAFYMWLAGQMAAPYAALITAGMILSMALLILAGIAVSKPRHPPPSQTRHLGEAVGVAVASRLLTEMMKKLSPRTLLVGGAVAAGLVAGAVLLARVRRDRRRQD